MVDSREREELSDSEVLELQYESAQARLAEQRDTIKSFSQEATRLFRILLILITLPATVLGVFNTPMINRVTSVLTSDTVVGTALTTPVSAVDLSLIVFGALVIGAWLNWFSSGFDARAPRKASNPNDLYITLTESMTKEKHLEHTLNMYLNRIEENDKTINQIENYLVLGKAPVLVAIYGLGVFGVYLISGTQLPMVVTVVLLVALLAVFQRKFPDTFRQADSNWNFNPPYEVEYDEYRDDIDESSANLRPQTTDSVEQQNPERVESETETAEQSK